MKASVIRKKGELLLNLNGKTFFPSAYMSYVTQNGDYESFKKAGYRLFFGCVQMGDTFLPFTDSIWKSQKKYDFLPVKEVLDRIIGDSVQSEIYIILRINLNVPKWWIEKYPDQVMQDSLGNKWLQSPASKRWRKDCVDFLRRLTDYIVGNGYGEYVAGYHLAGLATEEWYIPENGDIVYDFSPVGVNAFREYCSKKYNSIKCFNDIYQTDYSSFNEVEVPTCSERYTFSLKKGYRDLKKDIRGFDYFGFCGEYVSDAICYLAEKTKEIIGKNRLVGVFYGYSNVLPSYSGHTLLKKVLSCKHIDFLASPFAYVNQRKGAYDWFFDGAFNSAKKAGKLWFAESDVRTCLTKPLTESFPPCLKDKDENFKKRYYQPVWFGPDSEEYSLYHITKAMGKIVCSGAPFWWFDMWGGWYNSDAFIKRICELDDIYADSLQNGFSKNAEIAVIVDDKTTLYTDNTYFSDIICKQYIELGYVGAPYDIYLFDDLENTDLSHYRTVLFISPLNVSDERARIINGLKSDGKSLMFCGKVGIYSGNCDILTDNISSSNDRNFSVYCSPDRCFTAEEVRTAHIKAKGHIYSGSGDVVYANGKYVFVVSASEGKRKIFLPKGKTGEILFGKTDYTVDNGVIDVFLKTEETVVIKLI